MFGFNPWVLHLGYVIERVELEQFSLSILCFPYQHSPAIISPYSLFINDTIQSYQLTVQINNENIHTHTHTHTHTHIACKVLHIRPVNIHALQVTYCMFGQWTYIYN